MRIHRDPLQRFARTIRGEATACSTSASHDVDGESRGVVSLKHTQRCGLIQRPPPLLQLFWHLLHTLMALGAVRLTFRVTLEVSYRLLSGRYPTLFPSPHLRRLGPELAARQYVCHIPGCRDPMTRHHLIELPLLWFSKERPSAVFQPSVSCPNRPLLRDRDPRHLTAKSNAPSIPAVPPGFNGLLHKWPCRFVSPYCRPWGSSRFQPNLPPTTLLRWSVPWVFLRPAYRTLRSVPLRDSRTVSPQPLPSRRCLPSLFPAPLTRPQGFAPSRSPFPGDDVATTTKPDASLGFVPLQGSPLILERSFEVLLSHPAEAASLWVRPAKAGSP